MTDISQETHSFVVKTVTSAANRYTSLKGIDVEQVPNASLCYTEDTDVTYIWDDTSTAAPDGVNVVIPDQYTIADTGRWILQSSGGGGTSYYQTVKTQPVDSTTTTQPQRAIIKFANLNGSDVSSETVITAYYQRVSENIDASGITLTTARPKLCFEGSSRALNVSDDGASDSTVVEIKDQNPVVYLNSVYATPSREGLNIVGLPSSDATPSLTDNAGLPGKNINLYYQKVQNNGSDVGSALRLNFAGSAVTGVVTSGGVTTVTVTDSGTAGVQSVYGVPVYGSATSVFSRGTLRFENVNVVDLGLSADTVRIDIPYPTSDDKNLNSSSNITTDGATTGLTITNTPVGYVGVLVGGILRWTATDNTERTTAECYFSSDGGTTAKAQGSLASGDTLYWNAVASSINLATTDRIDFVYNQE